MVPGAAQAVYARRYNFQITRKGGGYKQLQHNTIDY